MNESQAYKVGCVSEVMQRQLGLDRPVFGHVFATEFYASGVELELGNRVGLAIEGELAVRIGQDSVVAAAFPVIELHNYTFRNNPHTAQELIGNNAIHAGVILPDTEPPCTDPAVLRDAEIEVSINGAVLGTASGRALPGGPALSVARLVEHLARFGCPLREGYIVLTGSPLPLYRVSAGDQIEVTSGQLLAVRGTVARTVVAGFP